MLNIKPIYPYTNSKASIIVAKCNVCLKQLPLQIVFLASGAYNFKKLNNNVNIFVVPIAENGVVTTVACCCAECKGLPRYKNSEMIEL